MKKILTSEKLDLVARLQREGLPNTVIAVRLGVSSSALKHALARAAFGGSNKFGARRTVCSAGHPHPSALECSVCEIHLARQRAGEIRNLKWQETVLLDYGTKWKVDWGYDAAPDWKRAYSEAKGPEGRDYKLKRRMWKAGCGPGRLEIWKGTARRPFIVEVIEPKEET